MRCKADATKFVCTLFLKMIFVWPVKLIIWLVRLILNACANHSTVEYYDNNDWVSNETDDDDIEEEIVENDDFVEMPEMCQVFPLGPDTCVGVQFVSMCPDETAHIRIIGEESFSELYKRKVYRDKTEERRRYFILNSEKYYLDDKRTKPIKPSQAKEGK